MLHDGHIDILKQAKNKCEYLIVAVGTDEFMRKRKFRDSVLSYNQRVEIVKSIKYVDDVVPEEDLDKIAAYEMYHFDVMFAGDDHKKESIYIEAEKQLKILGVDTIYIPRAINCSSTAIRERIIQLKNKEKYI